MRGEEGGGTSGRGFAVRSSSTSQSIAPRPGPGGAGGPPARHGPKQQQARSGKRGEGWMAGRRGGWTWVYNDNKRRAGVEWFLSPSPVVCPFLPCERGRFKKGVVYGDGTYSRGLNEPCRSQTLGETVDPAWSGVGPWDELRAQREDETSILLVLLLLLGSVRWAWWQWGLWRVGSVCRRLPLIINSASLRLCFGGPWETTDEVDFVCGDGREFCLAKLEPNLQKFKRISISSSGRGRHNLPWTLRRRRRVSQLQALLLGGHFWATPALRLLVWGGLWPVRVPWGN